MKFYRLDVNNIEDYLKLSDSIEAYPLEGEILVDNGYVKHGQIFVITAAGSVYCIEEDLFEELGVGLSIL